MTIETQAGIIHAEVLEETVCLILTDPSDWRMGLDIGLEQPADFVNTLGVVRCRDRTLNE